MDMSFELRNKQPEVMCNTLVDQNDICCSNNWLGNSAYFGMAIPVLNSVCSFHGRTKVIATLLLSTESFFRHALLMWTATCTNTMAEPILDIMHMDNDMVHFVTFIPDRSVSSYHDSIYFFMQSFAPVLMMYSWSLWLWCIATWPQQNKKTQGVFVFWRLFWCLLDWFKWTAVSV